MGKKVKNKATIEIKASMRVSLGTQFKNDAGGIRNTLSFTSVVEEVLDDGCLLIHMPIYQGYHYPLPRDNKILMHFFTDTQMYALPVQFQERIQQHNFQYAKVRRARRIRLHQRRDYYRLPCSFPVTVERLWIHERDRYPERQPTEGQMINFSDGGMLFATDEDIEKGEKVTLIFDMGRVETVEGMALRAERVTDRKYKFRVAVQFRSKDKDKAQKRRFYKYIVEKQMEERRRQTQDIKPLYPTKKRKPQIRIHALTKCGRGILYAQNLKREVLYWQSTH